MNDKKLVIGIVGMPGSGKSEVGKILKRKGFVVMEFGDIIRDIMKRNNIPINNRSIREFSIKFKRKHGDDILAKEITKKIISMNRKKFALVGIRSKVEIDYLRKHLKNFILVAVMAPKEIRFKRIVKRGREDDFKSKRDFEYREKMEEKLGVTKAIKLADIYLFNTSTRADLERSVKVLLEYAENKT